MQLQRYRDNVFHAGKSTLSNLITVSERSYSAGMAIGGGQSSEALRFAQNWQKCPIFLRFKWLKLLKIALLHLNFIFFRGGDSCISLMKI